MPVPVKDVARARLNPSLVLPLLQGLKRECWWCMQPQNVWGRFSFRPVGGGSQVSMKSARSIRMWGLPVALQAYQEWCRCSLSLARASVQVTWSGLSAIWWWTRDCCRFLVHRWPAEPAFFFSQFWKRQDLSGHACRSLSPPLIPAIIMEGQVIQIFDPQVHRQVDRRSAKTILSRSDGPPVGFVRAPHGYRWR